MKVRSTHAGALRAEFQQLHDERRLTPALAAQLGEHAGRACLVSPGELEGAVSLLCELARLDDPDLARGGVDGIFRHAVEAMGDAFEAELCDRYIGFFARVLEQCRRWPAAQWLDERLNRLGLYTEQDLIRRAVSLRHPRPAASRDVQKVLILSRVTLGADVAITSVILRKMMRLFPAARLILLGSPKAALLFAGERRVEVDRKSTRLNSSHIQKSRMPSSA